MTTLDPRDGCPSCGENLLNRALANDLYAGDEIDCPRCGRRFVISEHSDGWTNWMSFHPATPEDPGGDAE